jgi:hypothetical protein
MNEVIQQMANADIMSLSQLAASINAEHDQLESAVKQGLAHALGRVDNTWAALALWATAKAP